MSSLKLWLKGYVKIYLKGEHQERFINICKSRLIGMYKLHKPVNNYYVSVKLSDFYDLKTITSKTRVYPIIYKRKGLPFIIHRISKHPLLITITLIFVVLYLYCSTLLWNINISGNCYYSSPQIEKFLKANSIYEGLKLNSIDCDKIEALIRNNYQNINWVSAYINNNSLYINLKEGTNSSKVILSKRKNIYSIRDGKIISIITRSGIPLVKPGDKVTKDTKLVDSKIILENENLQRQKLYYSGADADIIIGSKRNISFSIQRIKDIKSLTGNYYTNYSLDFEKDKLFSYTYSIPYKTCAIITWVRDFDKRIPLISSLRLNCINHLEYNTISVIQNDAQLKQALLDKYNNYISRLSHQGINTKSLKYKIKLYDSFGIINGKIYSEGDFTIKK